MAWLQVLPAMGMLYCLGACCSHWRPLDIPSTHLPNNTMQLIKRGLTVPPNVLIPKFVPTFAGSIEYEVLMIVFKIPVLTK